jgi:hypothetical protein
MNTAEPVNCLRKHGRRSASTGSSVDRSISAGVVDVAVCASSLALWADESIGAPETLSVTGWSAAGYWLISERVRIMWDELGSSRWARGVWR